MGKRVSMSEDRFEYIQARINTQEEEESLFKNSDPFQKNWEKLKEYPKFGGSKEYFNKLYGKKDANR